MIFGDALPAGASPFSCPDATIACPYLLDHGRICSLVAGALPSRLIRGGLSGLIPNRRGRRGLPVDRSLGVGRCSWWNGGTCPALVWGVGARQLRLSGQRCRRAEQSRAALAADLSGVQHGAGARHAGRGYGDRPVPRLHHSKAFGYATQCTASTASIIPRQSALSSRAAVQHCRRADPAYSRRFCGPARKACSLNDWSRALMCQRPAHR